LGALLDAVRLGGAGADHPDHHARLRRDDHPVGDRSHGQCRPPVSDGGLGAALDVHADDETARAVFRGASHRGDTVGRMPSLPAAGAARAPDRIRQRTWLRACLGVSHRQHGRLFPCRESDPDAWGGDPFSDAAVLPVLDRAPQPRGRRRRRARDGGSALSIGREDEFRPRHPRQRPRGGHHRLWRALVAGGARMSFAQLIGDWHALAVLFVAGVVPNQIWRMLGLWFGGGIDEGSELLVWVRAVATAILAGVIAQIVVEPPGALASVPDALRYGAVGAGLVVFLLTRRSIFAGVVAGEVFMLAGKWWLG